MFYPVESLRKGGRFYLCWVADSWPLRFATITHRQLWAQDIRVICDKLLEVMNNESGLITKRFSLRLSSQLLRGLLRLYQKKIEVFICDVCMLNAIVMKMSHKKYARNSVGPAGSKRSPTGELPIIRIEEIDDEEVERRFQSSNVVARVEDITLREPTLPEHQLLLNDGFGELHRDQPLLAIIDRSVETMLAQETSAIRHSALDLPHDFSDKSHDKSRLAPHDAAQMEKISEHEISIFRKSAEAPTLLDFGKEIPEISEIPPTDLTAPQPDNQVAEIGIEAPEDSLHKDQPATEKNITDVQDIILEDQPATEKNINGVQDIILEELEEEPVSKKRKLKNKLIVDKRIQLSSDFLRARIGSNNLELRCENIKENKAISIVTPSYVLLNRAAHCGPATYTRFGITLGNMFKRARGTLEVPRTPIQDAEHTLFPRTTHPATLLETIAEESMISRDKTIPEQELQEISLQDISRIQEERSVVIPPGEVMDISELPTQKIPMASPPEKRASQFEEPAKKRRADKVFRRRSGVDMLSAQEMNKENILEEDTVPTKQPDVTRAQTITERLTSLLQTEGLADVHDVSKGIEPTTVGQEGHRKNSSDTSETPLGSLDRTKVSLGESEMSTDSKIFIRQEWGVEATMFKIFRCIRSGVGPITVDTLLSRGPVIVGYKRFIAARCFSSILKLKQHGFIKVITDDDSKEIKDITLGRILLT